MTHEAQDVVAALSLMPISERRAAYKQLTQAVLGSSDPRFSDALFTLAESDDDDVYDLLIEVLHEAITEEYATIADRLEATPPLVSAPIVRPPSNSRPQPEPDASGLDTARSIYLDRNVIQQLQNGSYQHIAARLDRLQDQGVVIPYSSTHIEEAVNIPTDEPRKEAFTEANLAFLAKRTRNHRWSVPDSPNDGIQLTISPPRAKAVDANQSRAARLLHFLLEMPKEPLGNSIRSAMGFDPKLLSYYRPEEVITEIDRALASLADISRSAAVERRLPVPSDLPTNVEEWQQGMRHALGFPLHQARDFAAFFHMLDLFGFRPERRGRGTAGFRDGQHAYAASFADALVTRDGRLIQKARCAYHFFKKTTVVYHADLLEEAFTTPPTG